VKEKKKGKYIRTAYSNAQLMTLKNILYGTLFLTKIQRIQIARF